MEKTSGKQFRIRRQINQKRRWTQEEEIQILDYLNANQPIEVPSAISYYNRLVQDLHWDMNPQLLRFKVQNMRRVFNKAMEFGQEAKKNGWSDEKINRHIKKTCRYFKKMQEVFTNFMKAKELRGKGSALVNVHENNSEDEDDTMAETENDEASSILHAEKGDYVQITQNKVEIEDPDMSWISRPTTPIASGQTGGFSDPLRDLDSAIFAKPTRADSFELKKEYLSLEHFRLEVEKDKLQIARDKLAMERQKITDDVNYKILQLEQQERIKMHQIDKEADVRRYELTLKYKDGVKTEM